MGFVDFLRDFLGAMTESPEYHERRRRQMAELDAQVEMRRRKEDEAWDRKRLERQRQNHKGGWGEVTHGWVGDKPVTFAKDWGTRAGETLLADGHISPRAFMQSNGHNHYGKGKGPNLNVRDRGRYGGPGA